MASNLQQLIAQFTTAFGADDEDHPMNGKIFFGKKHVHAHRDAPRIVIYRTQGNFESVDQPGADKYEVGDPPTTVRTRKILVRHVGVETYCHGRDDQETETLLVNACQAWRSIAHPSVTFDGETWPSQEEGESDLRGEAAVLSLKLHCPVFDVQIPLQYVTGITDEDVLIRPDGTEESFDCKPPATP